MASEYPIRVDHWGFVKANTFESNCGNSTNPEQKSQAAPNGFGRIIEK